MCVSSEIITIRQVFIHMFHYSMSHNTSDLLELCFIFGFYLNCPFPFFIEIWQNSCKFLLLYVMQKSMYHRQMSPLLVFNHD